MLVKWGQCTFSFVFDGLFVLSEIEQEKDKKGKANENKPPKYEALALCYANR